MNTNQLRERYLVAKMFTEHCDRLRPQPFESEVDRWLELVTALLMQAGNASEGEACAATDLLAALRLLDAADCAELKPGDEKATLIEEVLCDHGFTPENAAIGRQAIQEVSLALTRRWGGKAQRFLRDWGDQLLNDLPEMFAVQALPTEAVRQAFGFWLQSVLGLPVLLPDPRVREYAMSQATTLDNLVAAADALDLNVALLDELVAIESAGPSAEEEA